MWAVKNRFLHQIVFIHECKLKVKLLEHDLLKWRGDTTQRQVWELQRKGCLAVAQLCEWQGVRINTGHIPEHPVSLANSHNVLLKGVLNVPNPLWGEVEACSWKICLKRSPDRISEILVTSFLRLSSATADPQLQGEIFHPHLSKYKHSLAVGSVLFWLAFPAEQRLRLKGEPKPSRATLCPQQQSRNSCVLSFPFPRR